jgi:hypothetical protein
MDETQQNNKLVQLAKWKIKSRSVHIYANVQMQQIDNSM